MPLIILKMIFIFVSIGTVIKYLFPSILPFKWELHSYILGATQALFGDFSPYTVYVLSFHIPYYFIILLVSASSSYFTLAVPVCEVQVYVLCGIYTPRAWYSRSLQSKLNSLLYFDLLQRFRSDYILLQASYIIIKI